MRRLALALALASAALIPAASAQAKVRTLGHYRVDLTAHWTAGGSFDEQSTGGTTRTGQANLKVDAHWFALVTLRSGVTLLSHRSSVEIPNANASKITTAMNIPLGGPNATATLDGAWSGTVPDPYTGTTTPYTCGYHFADQTFGKYLRVSYAARELGHNNPPSDGRKAPLLIQLALTENASGHSESSDRLKSSCQPSSVNNPPFPGVEFGLFDSQFRQGNPDIPRFHFTMKELLTGKTAKREMHTAAAASAAVPVDSIQGTNDVAVTATMHKLR